MTNINIMETATDLVTGSLDICDLVDDVQFLSEIDNSLKSLFESRIYSGNQINRKRKLLLDKISYLNGEKEG